MFFSNSFPSMIPLIPLNRLFEVFVKSVGICFKIRQHKKEPRPPNHINIVLRAKRKPDSCLPQIPWPKALCNPSKSTPTNYYKHIISYIILDSLLDVELAYNPEEVASCIMSNVKSPLFFFQRRTFIYKSYNYNSSSQDSRFINNSDLSYGGNFAKPKPQDILLNFLQTTTHHKSPRFSTSPIKP